MVFKLQFIVKKKSFSSSLDGLIITVEIIKLMFRGGICMISSIFHLSYSSQWLTIGKSDSAVDSPTLIYLINRPQRNQVSVQNLVICRLSIPFPNSLKSIDLAFKMPFHAWESVDFITAYIKFCFLKYFCFKTSTHKLFVFLHRFQPNLAKRAKIKFILESFFCILFFFCIFYFLHPIANKFRIWYILDII